MDEKLKEHWEKIYQKESKELSWYQDIPTISLNFINSFNLTKEANIIDVGGGDSKLVDFLLDEGYENITVLDISLKALDTAKIRLDEKAKKVIWINSDILDFHFDIKYDLWHDRAAFHFLTTEREIKNYIRTVTECIKPNGYLVIGTFSEQGPKRCSGLAIKQYSEKSMTELLKENFKKIKCITVDHKTPFDIIQNFIFCSFQKRAVA